MGFWNFLSKKKHHNVNQVVPSYDYVVLDTETTGLEYDDEIVEIAIVSNTGEVLLNTLVKPYSPMPPDCYAVKIHGITNKMLENAPRWHEIHEQVQNIVKNNKVIIYNEKFDSRLIEQTCSKYGLKSPLKQTHCAMLEYGKWFGDGRWHKLSKAVEYMGLSFEGQQHRALSDCLATLAVYQMMQTKTKQDIKNSYRDSVNQKMQQTFQSFLNLGANCLVLNVNANGRIPAKSILEIAIVDMTGQVLLNTFIQPKQKIRKNTQYLNHLNMQPDDFLAFPTWQEIYPCIQEVIADKTVFSLHYPHQIVGNLIKSENEKYGLEHLYLDLKELIINETNQGNLTWQQLADICHIVPNGNLYYSLTECNQFIDLFRHISKYGLTRKT